MQRLRKVQGPDERTLKAEIHLDDANLAMHHEHHPESNQIGVISQRSQSAFFIQLIINFRWTTWRRIIEGDTPPHQEMDRDVALDAV